MSLFFGLTSTHVKIGTSGGPVSGAHRYWGVRVNATQGDPTAQIQNIEMATSHFGPNILPVDGTGAGATSVSSGFPAQYALTSFEQTGHDPWASQSGATSPIWFYDFGAGNDKLIKRVTMLGRGSFIAQNPKDFDVVYSDDGSYWSTAWTITGADTNKTFYVGHYFAPGMPSYSGSPWGSHTHWRLVCLESTVPAIAELEYHSTVGGANQATGGTASASTVYGGFLPAENAFDGNPSTMWSSSTSNIEWLQFQKSGGFSVAEFKLTARNDSYPFTTPNKMVLRFSDDGSQFTTMLNPPDTVGASWASGESRTFIDPYYV